MSSGRRLLLHIVAACTAWASTAAAEPWPTPPRASLHAFRYEAMEVSPVSTKGYRTDFRLRTDGRGGVTADIVSSQIYDGKAWTPVTIDDACRKAMAAPRGGLARVQLYPLTPERARLGDAFLAPCAPAGVFFPLTDILNVALIVASERFGAYKLARAGDTASFPGFSTSLDRLGLQMNERSEGGEVALVSMTRDEAALDWKPTPSRLDMVEKGHGAPVHLSGTETFAFRAVVDRRTGSLVRAQTLYDDLDLAVAVPGAPADKLPRLAVKRSVAIAPLTAR